MDKLPIDWLTSGLIDLEYKRYVLLAYLKGVKAKFADKHLYPQLTDLVFHYRNLKDLQHHKELFYSSFQGRISKADWEKLELVYEKIVKDDEVMSELEAIMTWAIPRFDETLQEGVEIYAEVEDHVEISPIGVTSMYPKEGLAFLYVDGEKKTSLYQYRLTLFTEAREQYRSLEMEYLQDYAYNLSNTMESLKIEAIKTFHPHWSSPAAYLLLSRRHYPKQETLLPVAKRRFVAYISKELGEVQ